MALAHLQRGNIAPVDLAQSAIGPGMAVFTRYSKVIEADGSPTLERRRAGRDGDPPRRLAAILVAVHEDPVPSSRPGRQECLERHRALLADLEPRAKAPALPICWNALWRLPPGLKVPAPGRAAWLRFPAVSFLAAVRPLTRGNTP
jgi:hypothetical protein